MTLHPGERRGGHQLRQRGRLRHRWFAGERSGIEVTTNSTSLPLDTCAIIGNKVKSIVGYEGIYCNTAAQVLHPEQLHPAFGWMGIEVYEGNTSAVQNLIWNNTVTAYRPVHHLRHQPGQHQCRQHLGGHEQRGDPHLEQHQPGINNDSGTGAIDVAKSTSPAT